MVSVQLSDGKCAGRAVIALRGDLDVLDAASVGAAITASVARDPHLILDLAGLEFIDCSALGALLQVQHAAQRAGGDLLLAAPQPRVARLLALTGLAGVFSVHASAEQAAAATRDSRPAVAAGVGLSSWT